MDFHKSSCVARLCICFGNLNNFLTDSYLFFVFADIIKLFSAR